MREGGYLIQMTILVLCVCFAAPRGHPVPIPAISVVDFVAGERMKNGEARNQMMANENIVWEVKPIEWYRFPAEVEEGKGLCIFCNTVATHMRRQSEGQWQALCAEHKDSTEQL